MINLKQKILDLFALRRLPALLQAAGVSTLDPIYVSVIQLQQQIYLLDKYLEDHWEIEADELVPLWNNIYREMAELNYSEEQTHDLLSHLKIYEQGELRMRQHHFPHQTQIRPFYYFKSCDVKLVRYILYEYFPQIQNVVPLNQWILFDLVTELIDDIEDETEDRNAFNGNRFLFSLFHHGVLKTLDEYKTFTAYLNKTFERNQEFWTPLVHQSTRQVLNQLNHILDEYKFDPEPRFSVPTIVDIQEETLSLFNGST